MTLMRFSPLWLRLLTLLSLLSAVFSVAPGQGVQAAGTRYYVRASGGNDASSGLSWAQAFKTLQATLTVANSGDEVWVAKGVYFPDEGGAYPNGNRNATFTLEDGVAIYGGFAGNEALLFQRDIAANRTILSGDVDNNDTNTDGNFIAETTSDIVGGNAYHVVTTGGNADTAILDGFAVTAGQANAIPYPTDRGGGVFAYQSSATLRNLTFSGNYAWMGGGIYKDGGALTVSDCTFFGNSASSGGGGIMNWTGALTVTNSAFASNIAVNSNGGGIRNEGTLTVSNSFFVGNSAGNGGGIVTGGIQAAVTISNTIFSANSASYGGGIWNDANLTISDSAFSANSAGQDGGGIWNDGKNVGLWNVTFQSNTAVSGGGMYNLNSNPDIRFSTFKSNQAAFGGGLSNDNSKPSLFASTFDSNTATQVGGAMQNINGSHANIQMTTIQNNQANVGGGIYNYVSNPVIRNADLHNNRAMSSATGGGGMYNYTSSPVLERVTFAGNSTPGAGGGMYNYQGSNPGLTDVAFSGNDAYNGGGMRNHVGNNQPELNRVTFVGNEAAYGGGMSNDNSTPKLTNVTFSGNLAQRQGGGMINYQSSPALANVTFYGNTAEETGGGGGMYNLSSSQPFLRNVILAGSTNGDCVNGAGGSISGGYSLIHDSGPYACGAVHGNNGFIVGESARLGPLAKNGGFTATHLLLPGSPAIDAVLNNNCPNSDQRSALRPQRAAAVRTGAGFHRASCAMRMTV